MQSLCVSSWFAQGSKQHCTIYDQAAFISKLWVLLDYFKGQGTPILLESTVKTGANPLGAPSECTCLLVCSPINKFSGIKKC